MTPEILAIIMFVTTLLFLLFGFPVAFTLAGSALIFAFIGDLLDIFNFRMLFFFPQRIYGIMINEALVAVPLFIFMGVMLEKTNIAAKLLVSIGDLFGSVRGGLGIGVVLVGMLLAASTGIVGATVVTMGMLALPTMLKAGYDEKIATGTICASGTLGQIIPPSIVLILLAEMLQGANEEAGLMTGDLAPLPVTAIDLFAGALFPGLLLVFLYLSYQIIIAFINPSSSPPLVSHQENNDEDTNVFDLIKIISAPLILIIIVLGSILTGIATPTESAAVGAVGATVIAIVSNQFTFQILKTVSQETTKISSMVFIILIGASMFSLVFRGFGGDIVVEEFLMNLPGGAISAMLIVMAIIFFLGFFLDFIEIIFVVVPIVSPILIAMGFNPLWLGVMIGINLQTSFLTPPFGFSLFYLRGVAPKEVKTKDIYLGVLPFIFIQLVGLSLIWIFPQIVLWLPNLIFK